MKIMEFKLQGDFNNKDTINGSFQNLFTIYLEVLKKDQNWHFFYEGDYSFLRCSKEYVKEVKSILDEYHIEYVWPLKEWEEPFEFTRRMQKQFSLVFHSLSVLVMEIYQKESINDNLIYYAADRVIHPFLNMSTYLQCYIGKNIMANWEAEILSKLAVFRAYSVGRRIGWFEKEETIEKEN